MAKIESTAREYGLDPFDSMVKMNHGGWVAVDEHLADLTCANAEIARQASEIEQLKIQIDDLREKRDDLARWCVRDESDRDALAKYHRLTINDLGTVTETSDGQIHHIRADGGGAGADYPRLVCGWGRCRA